MATLHVRKSGNDSNTYSDAQTPATAWLTIGKALTDALDGDTVYIGAGAYRESVTVALTSPTTETKFIGDVDGAHTGDPGEIRWTAYTTNDKTTPTNTPTLILAGRDYLTFQNIVFVGGTSGGGYNASIVDGTNTVNSNHITFTDCTFLPGADCTQALVHFTGANDGGGPSAGIPQIWLFDRCRFMRTNNHVIHAIVPRADSAEYSFDLTVKNCLFIGGGEPISGGDGSACCIFITSAGAESYYGGDMKILNCTAIGGGSFVRTNEVASSNPCVILNCALIGCGLYSASSSQILEDYNIIATSVPHTNVSAGGNTQYGGAYSYLFHIGQELAQGRYGRPIMAPTIDSPALAYGGSSVPGVDILNAPRPAGPGVTWSSSTSAVGCLEHGNSGQKETSTTRSSPASLKIKGPGYHDFDFPVDATSTTIAVYGRYDSSYGGTLPQMKVLNGTECGVADATATMGGAADTWTQMFLTFTPTSKGIVTIRLLSSCDNTTGIAFFDDFSVA